MDKMPFSRIEPLSREEKKRVSNWPLELLALEKAREDIVKQFLNFKEDSLTIAFKEWERASQEESKALEEFQKKTDTSEAWGTVQKTVSCVASVFSILGGIFNCISGNVAGGIFLIVAGATHITNTFLGHQYQLLASKLSDDPDTQEKIASGLWWTVSIVSLVTGVAGFWQGGLASSNELLNLIDKASKISTTATTAIGGFTTFRAKKAESMNMEAKGHSFLREKDVKEIMKTLRNAFSQNGQAFTIAAIVLHAYQQCLQQTSA